MLSNPIPGSVFAATVSAAILLCGCDRIPDGKDAYVGTWKSPQATLVISRHGRMTYHRPQTADRIEERLSAPIERFSESAILGPGGIWLEVNQPPHRQGDTWRMTVNGDVLTRQ
jgi:hypothetical protein